MRAYYAMPKVRSDPPFRCGFQPEGKPFRVYVEHLSNCRNRECIARYERRDAMRMYFLSKYAILRTNAPPYAPSPDSHAPLASATARPRRDNPSSY